MNIEETVISVIADALNVDDTLITKDLSIGDIPEWDSVGNLAIISSIEAKMDIEIPLEDLFDLTSVALLIDEVEKLKA